MSNNTAAKNLIRKLDEFRRNQSKFKVFDKYDEVTGTAQSGAEEKIKLLDEPLRSVATRLFHISSEATFLVLVAKWKIDFLAEALIHAIEVKNPVSLANDTRALLEHLAALEAVVKEIDKLRKDLRNKGVQTSIDNTLKRTEMYLHRVYFGNSPKVEKEKSKQALHVNECISDLNKIFENAGEMYGFLCEHVHPNYGSNALVSTSGSGNRQLNPPEEFTSDSMARLVASCDACLSFLEEHAVRHFATIAQLHSLFNLCFADGAKITNVFSVKSAIPTGDGKSKETAFFFPSARNYEEEIELTYRFLGENSYQDCDRQLAGIEAGMLYDVWQTNKGIIWFKYTMPNVK